MGFQRLHEASAFLGDVGRLATQKARLFEGAIDAGRAAGDGLLLANACFQDLRSSQKLATLPHMRRKIRKLARGSGALLASYKKEIGAEWSSILHNTRTYSGFGVETLAKVVGQPFERWYEMIYHFQSINVHAGDPLGHFTVSDDEELRATYVSSDGELWQALTPAITMFFIVIDTLQQSVGYGPDVNHAYISIKKQYKGHRAAH